MSIIIKQIPGPLFETVDKTGLRVRTSALVCTTGGAKKLTTGQPVTIGTKLSPDNYDVTMADDGTLRLCAAAAGVPPQDVIGGATFAPGGCAPRRDGGDEVPQWNPFSIWDRTWRPACPDPRGMALVAERFWVDIYLAAKATTAGRQLRILDFITAYRATLLAELAGKSLPTAEEYKELALGVREGTSLEIYQEYVGLDVPRTSRFGIMQATGCRYIWLRIESDPTDKLSAEILRAGVAGGYWAYGASCGSRRVVWADAPSRSSAGIGARFRCDHLVLM